MPHHIVEIQDKRIAELEAQNSELREAIDAIAQLCDDGPDNTGSQRIWEMCEPFLKGSESLRKEATLGQAVIDEAVRLCKYSEYRKDSVKLLAALQNAVKALQSREGAKP